MTQKARPQNYNHLKKEWVVVRTSVDTHDGLPEKRIVTVPLTHKQAIEMVVYLKRNNTPDVIDLEKLEVSK
jgi:hypothetical protein